MRYLLLGLLPLAAAAEPVKVVAVDHKSPVAYEKDVEPVFLNKCSACHSGNVKKGRLDLGSYESLLKGGKHGNPVVAGRADESLLYKVTARNAKPAMPPDGEDPLTPEEVATLKLWIDQGARPPSMARAKAKVVVAAPPAVVHPVRALAVSPDKSAVAASRGNQIHLYDARTGAHARALADPALAAPDKKTPATAHLSLVESLAYSPDGRTLASGAYQEVLLWDVRSGAVRQRLTGFADRVVALAFSPDGKLLATGGGAPTEDGEVRLFDAASGRLVADLKSAHSDTVFGVAFRPDGKVLATGGADKFVKAWEVPSGKFVRSFEGHTHHVLDVGWKADGKLLASAGADNVIKVWEYEKGEQARTIAGHVKQVTRLAFLGTKPEFVTCAGDGQVKMWNVDNGGNVRNFDGGGDYLYALGVSADGSVVAVGGEGGAVRLFNGTNGQLVKTLLPPGADAAAKK